MKHEGQRTTASAKRARAFTLIELLIVIGIIAVLVAIGLTLAPSVINSGRSQATQSTILALETLQSTLSAETDLRPKDFAAYTIVDRTGTEFVLPIADGRLSTQGVDRSERAIPSLGRFLLFARETVANIEETWTQLDSSSVRVTEDLGDEQIELGGDEILDAWGNPIRFVHPSYDGGHGNWYSLQGRVNPRDNLDLPNGTSGSSLMLRRSFRPYSPGGGPLVGTDAAPDPIGDADEGIVPGGASGYLYSAGPDGDPGTRADNVYASVIPEYPAETRDED